MDCETVVGRVVLLIKAWLDQIKPHLNVLLNESIQGSQFDNQ